MTLVKWQPNHLVNYWEKEVEDLFNEFFKMENVGLDWQPKAEFRESIEAYQVEIELPGVDKKAISVELDKDQLRVKGEKKNENKETEEDYYQSERSFGSFSRQFTIPGPVKIDAITAEFDNGLLQVTVPKAGAAKLKTITIN